MYIHGIYLFMVLSFPLFLFLSSPLCYKRELSCTCVHSNAMTDSHNDFYMQAGSELALPEPRQQSADEEE